MTHGLFPEKVKLTEDHRYVHDDGRILMGFSQFFDNFLFKKFNAEAAAYGVAKAKIASGEQVTAQSVIEGWEKQRDEGIRFDSAIELYSKKKELLPENDDINELVKEVVAEYADYFKTFNQVVIYDETYMVAGTVDKFGITSNRPGSMFEMSDFKVFEKDNIHEHRGWLNSPLEHLPMTKFTKIAIQLSFYAYQLEKLTGKRCRKLFIHQINPIRKTHQKVYVPYLKTDIILLLETNKEKLLSLSTPSGMPVF